MAENIKIEIVTPEKYVVSESAQIVMAPGALGEFGVLAGHTPFLTSLEVGKVHYRDSGGSDKYAFVSGGFAEALPDRVTILAESAELKEDIDYERAKAAYDRAKKRLEEREETLDYTRAQAALHRALTRMKIAEGGGTLH
ncbi:MAG: F0F1 ATP synthase subunit epsilon [Desulfosalsimonas sp.]